MSERDKIVATTRRKLGWVYDELPWPSEELARQASARRDRLLEAIADASRQAYGGTKIHSGPLSPGCRICGDGFWSCMFINRICTQGCFFCPGDQNRELPPTASWEVSFADPDDYGDFVETFGFRGVGISGGEPLRSFDRVLELTHALRRRFGPDLYLWLYTNGQLVTRDRLQHLKKAGIDEIRFNIAGRSYRLDKVALATSVFATVTVEIPAVPEDHELLLASLPEMARLGVAHLNLHQMYADETNYRALVDRGYTFLHENLPPILESEMVALETIRYVAEQRIELPIHYCGSHYKQHYQGRGLRVRAGQAFREPYDELTAAGYIRRFRLEGSPAAIRGFAGQLAATAEDRFSVTRFETCMYAHREALVRSDWAGLTLSVDYYRSSCTPEPSSTHRELELAGGKKVFGQSDLRGTLEDIRSGGFLSLRRVIETGDGVERILQETFRSSPVASGGFAELARQLALVRSATVFERLPQGLGDIV